MSGCRIGIDIGGTNLKAGIVDSKGKLLASKKIPLKWENAETFADDLVQLSLRAAKAAHVKTEELVSVGMGVPGGVDGRRGEILHTCNIPICNVPIAKLFQRQLDLPVFLENDANCAAIGEYYAGAGRGCESIITVTLGTGVGVGFVLHGEILDGYNGGAGEAGHMVIEMGGELCTCGRRGCWEQYASARGLIRLTKQAMKKAPEGLLWEMCDGDLEKIGGRSAFHAAELGDPTGRAVCDSYIAYLAAGVTNLINLFQPEILCIGGGVSNEKEEALMNPLREIVERERFTQYCQKQTKIVKAELGNDAGIIGAALLGMKGTGVNA